MPMLPHWPIVLALLIPAVLLGACASDTDEKQTSAPPDSIREAVEQNVTAINEMRNSLAATIDTPAVDKKTFKRVCAPVGKRAKQVAQENNWTIQQLAEKYRNPNHQLDPEARRFYEHFAESPEATDTWTRTTRDGTDGWRYARRITVQSSCLACHGPKEKRPDFVKTGYPDDRAYGFEEGDLRGIYAVFVPDSTGASRR